MEDVKFEIDPIIPDKPLALRTCIRITNVSANEKFILPWEKLTGDFSEQYICLECNNISTKFNCPKCINFLSYPNNFFFLINDKKYMIPAPKNSSPKMLKFLSNFILFLHKKEAFLISLSELFNTKTGKELFVEYGKEPMQKQINGIIKNQTVKNKLDKFINNIAIDNGLISEFPQFKIDVLDSFFALELEKRYSNLIEQPINDGNIKEQLSGKNSYVRKKVLGSKNKAIRLVCIIDTTLGPDEVVIPKSIWSRIDFKTQYGIVNRFPSINSECIFVQKIKYCENNYPVIRISSFIADGLHCDQDGDELNLYIIENVNDIHDYTEHILFKEYSNNAFSSGEKCNFDYRPKISFGQHYDHVLYKHHDEMDKLWPNYTKLPCSKSNRPSFLMNLLCSMYSDVATNIISDIIEYFKTIKIETPKPLELLEGGDIIKNIYLSGSKGTENHYTKFLEQIKGMNETEYMNAAIAQFNKFILSSSSVSINGKNLYTKLAVFPNLHITQNNLLYQNVIVSENILDNPIVFNSRINCDAVSLVADNIKKIISNSTDVDDLNDICSLFVSSKFNRIKESPNNIIIKMKE